MSDDVKAVIHFNDGSKLKLGWPPQAGAKEEDEWKVARNVRKAFEADKIAVEVSGELLLIPMENVKYIHINPAPPKLPQSVLKNGYIIK